MDIEQVKNSVFAFDTGEKNITDCSREELLYIIAYQQATLEKQQTVVHKMFRLMPRARRAS